MLRVMGSDSAGGLWRCLFHFLFWNQFSSIYKSQESDITTYLVTSFCDYQHVANLVSSVSTYIPESF